MAATTNQSQLDKALWGPNGTEIFPSPNYKNLADQQLFIYANAIVRLLVALFGIASNAFIIHITRKYKNELFTTCAHLLTVNAFYDIVISASTLTTIVLTPFAWHVTFGTCLWLNLLPAIAFNANFVLIFAIAADRLAAAFFPIWHRLLNTIHYVTLLSAISAILGIVLFFVGLTYIQTDYNQPILKCTLTDMLPLTFAQYASLSFAIPAILCYAACWLKFRFGGAIANAAVNRGILRSLLLLASLILLCWVLGWAQKRLIVWLIPRPVPLGYISMNVPNLLITLNGSANALVLYFCSGHYRQIMRGELRKMLRRRRGQSAQPPSVVAVSAVQMCSEAAVVQFHSTAPMSARIVTNNGGN